jgi:hypothetical protein
MIILTPELAEKRIQARQVYPGCEWLPGDDCPSGMEVLSRHGDKCIVLNEYQPSSEHPELAYWWRVETPNKQIALEWPPTLKRV